MGRRDRLYCTPNCAKRAWEIRRKTGTEPPQRWQDPALGSDNPALQAAAACAQQLGEAHGWSPTTMLPVLDGLTTLLYDRAPGEPVPLSEVRERTSQHGRSLRVAEVLAEVELLDDDTTPAIRSWVERRSAELPTGFAPDVRAWMLLLLDGDARTRARSASTIYAYFGSVRPLLENWALTRGHLREITALDVVAVLDPLRGWPRSNAVTALRSLFRFATRRGIVFANPTARLADAGGERSLMPMSDAEILAVEQCVVTPAQRLVVALAAVHAARPATIRHLTIDHVDMPNRRITLEGIVQPLGGLTHRALRSWTEHRRDTWPHTPNRHLVISRGTSRGVGPIGHTYLTNRLLPAGVNIDRIRKDRVLHEALTVGADPLHLALVFNLAHTTAGRYAHFAQTLLDDQLERVDAPVTATPGYPHSNPVQSEAPTREKP